ncbi:hypothetical protein [Caulobacter sp. FWC2]|uniref:hypothetical protein n=1 Tax=Caulobacter sp. FWC2 TaxID=69664 RepID=UPI000C14A01A|nr:hypothetical protein [Caulobacter sp. FWC2]PIB91624.1 hypothetical protein CSW62_08605 [Caulobacter sp. FWC2]
MAIGLLGLIIYCGVYVGINHIVLSRSGGSMLHDIISGSIVGQYREALIYLPIIVVSAGLVALAHIGGLKPLDRLLEVKFFQRSGRSSYSGYLFHFAAVKACMFLVGGVVGLGLGANAAGLIGKSLVFICALPLTIAVAELSYAWVEKPSARYLARVLRT